MNEVVVNGACLKCSKGSALCTYKVPEGTRKKEGKTIAVSTDVGECIGSFGICDILTAKAGGVETPCIPHLVTFPWVLVNDDFLYRGQPVVLEISLTFCPIGGVISVEESGQTGEHRLTDSAKMEIESPKDLFKKILQLSEEGKFTNKLMGLGMAKGLPLKLNFKKALLSGIQRASASTGDPINTSTGNFYYEKTDLKIEGKYPLEFKRFYNTIGTVDNILGNGWTHSYYIKLIKEENKTH